VPLWRHSPRDAWVVALPLTLGLLAPALVWLSGHGLWGMSLATCALALAVWWQSNTVAHIHLHTPVFRARAHNRGFSLALTLLTGVPQTLWRARHLAHHRGETPSVHPGVHPGLGVHSGLGVRSGLSGAQGRLELGLLAHLWLLLAVLAPGFLLGVYLPGLLLGLGLCALQGRGEHLGPTPEGINHEGRLYNLLWLNDGYHAEHHRWPGLHWSALPGRRLADAARSRLPPVLRALLPADRPADAAHGPARRPVAALALALPRLLGGLERLALACPPLQRLLVRSHARAIARLMPALATCLPGHAPSDLSRTPLRIAVVGGGLFPRTALALARVWPAARVTLLDADAGHLERARAWLLARGHADLEFLHATWDPRAPPQCHDLVIVPLALVGDRAAAYTAAGPPRLVHDWLWRRRGPGVVVSWLLLKRINLVTPR
jgi:hypothetical protein